MVEAPGCLRVWYHPPQALVSSGGLLDLESKSLLPQRSGLERGTKFCLATPPTSVPKWVLPYRCHRAQLRVVATGFSQVRHQGLQTVLPPRISQALPKTLGQQPPPEESPGLWAPLSPPSMDVLPPGLLLHFGQRLHPNLKGFLLFTLK